MTHPINNSLGLDQKKQIEPSGLLPSGEANFFDFGQAQNFIINYYPSPSETELINSGDIYKALVEKLGISGAFVLHTPKPSGDLVSYPSGSIFTYENLTSIFSNASSGVYIYNPDGSISGIKISTFNIYNPYIHYYPENPKELDDIDLSNMKKDRALRIPYISSFKQTTETNPYPKKVSAKKGATGGLFSP